MSVTQDNNGGREIHWSLSSLYLRWFCAVVLCVSMPLLCSPLVSLQLLVDLLPSSPQVIVPGFASPVRNHWLLPVVVGGGPVGAASGVTADDVASVQRDLNDNGVDAYRGATQLALVPPPMEIKEGGQTTVRRRFPEGGRQGRT